MKLAGGTAELMLHVLNSLFGLNKAETVKMLHDLCATCLDLTDCQDWCCASTLPTIQLHASW